MQQDDQFDTSGPEFGADIGTIKQTKILGSQGHFERLVAKTKREINEIKLRNEKTESSRRFNEELQRQNRYESIQNEAQMAARKLAELDMRWSEYKEMEECQELAQSLEEHKKMFGSLVKSKESLIGNLSSHIENKDEEYMKAMETMKDDIDEIVSKMRTDFRMLRDQVGIELNHIEEELNEQRRKNLAKIKDEISEKFNNLRKSERDSTEAKNRDDKENAASLEALRVRSDKEFLDTKIKVEVEIQNCEKCYQDMKALYQLNSEKLSYNYRVLVEKNNENSKLQTDLKAKDADYQDQYKRKSTLYTTSYNNLININKKLTKSYTLLSKRYKDLHKKYQHFELTDKARYKEIRQMNEEEIQKMKEKIRNCDRIIHQHQLGVVWEPFTDTDIINEELGRLGLLLEEGAEDQDYKEEEEEPEEVEMKEDVDTNVPEDELHAIINLVMIELDFLLDDKVNNEIQDDPESQKLLVKMNVLRKVLAVKDHKEMMKLFANIYTGARKGPANALMDDIEGASRLTHSVIEGQEDGVGNPRRNIDVDQYNAQEFDQDERHMHGEEEENYARGGENGQGLEGEEEQLANISDLEKHYDPNKLISILSNFIQDKKNHMVLNNSDLQAKKRLKKQQKDDELKKQKMYRAKMSKALPEERLKMWKVLDKISSQYYKLLQERQKDIEETTQLHNQNDELKNLLNQYMKVNHNLLIPPTNMLNVNYLE